MKWNNLSQKKVQVVKARNILWEGDTPYPSRANPAALRCPPPPN